MNKIKILLILILSIALVSSVPVYAEENISVALILPGSISDAGWNASAYIGLQELAEKGYETAFTESVPIPDIEGAFRSYAEQGFDLILGHGYEFGEPALKVAPDFPETFFFVAGKKPPEAEVFPNLRFMDQQEFQGAYLCGYAAGLLTETNKIGIVGGLEIPTQISSFAAYTTGARDANPDVEVFGVLTGTYEDPEKGREAALAQIANGADVIMQVCDSTGMGVIQVAIEKGVKLIGYGTDQSPLAPDLFITSETQAIPAVVARQVDDIIAGVFGGDVWVAGVAEGVIDIAPLGEFVSEEDAIAIMARRDMVISGEFVVPEIFERIDNKVD